MDVCMDREMEAWREGWRKGRREGWTDGCVEGWRGEGWRDGGVIWECDPMGMVKGCDMRLCFVLLGCFSESS